MTSNPTLLGDGNGHVDQSGPGRWLQLRDAVQEIGSLEHLDRLAKDGRLQSRENAYGQLEVWVAHRHHFDDPSTRSLETGRPAESALPGGFRHTETDRQIAVLIAPLVESYERHVELARENGSLSERVVNLEREMDVLRATTGTDKHTPWHPLAHGQETVAERPEHRPTATGTFRDAFLEPDSEVPSSELPAVIADTPVDGVHADDTLGLASAIAQFVLIPLMAELSAARQLNERRADALRDQAETVATLSSDLDREHEIVRELQETIARKGARAGDLALTLMVLILVLSVGSVWWLVR
jgi:hypothetical protein